MKRKVLDLALAVAALGLLELAGNAFADGPVVIETCCPEGSCHKVCRPTTEIKKVPKRVYNSDCEDFCLPKCGLLGCLRGHTQCCEEGGGCAGRCGHVRTRKYLILKIQQKEECVTKCVVDQPACPVYVEHH
jgi:hypothetical protein